MELWMISYVVKRTSIGGDEYEAVSDGIYFDLETVEKRVEFLLATNYIIDVDYRKLSYIR